MLINIYAVYDLPHPGMETATRRRGDTEQGRDGHCRFAASPRTQYPRVAVLMNFPSHDHFRDPQCWHCIRNRDPLGVFTACADRKTQIRGNHIY